MPDLSRRKLLCGVGALIAAPAVVSYANIMPVRGIIMPTEYLYEVYAGYSSGFIVAQMKSLAECNALARENGANYVSIRRLKPLDVPWNGVHFRATRILFGCP